MLKLQHNSSMYVPLSLFSPSVQAVLETIRDLMNTECVVPDWLHDIILGYGNPGSAHYTKMPNQISSLNFNDTFLSLDHLRASFPGHTVNVTVSDPARQEPPFRYSPISFDAEFVLQPSFISVFEINVFQGARDIVLCSSVELSLMLVP